MEHGSSDNLPLISKVIMLLMYHRIIFLVCCKKDALEMRRYLDGLVKYIDEYFIPLDPNGVALDYKKIRRERDPLFLSHSRMYTELVRGLDVTLC